MNKQFYLESGTTGDASSITVSGVSTQAATALGLNSTVVSTETVATRGIYSTAATTSGSTPTVNTATNFSVDATNNKFIVTVDGIKSTVSLDIREYSLAEFTQALQDKINAMQEVRTDGLTPKEVNGVKVAFDTVKKAFQFTSGTTGADSFMKISGEPIWGLSAVEASRGETSSWIQPTQHVDYVNGTPQPKYIDAQGNETTSTDGYVGLPAWSPVYLDKGELTFDTGGKLVSPIEGTQLETVYLAGGKGALRINIDYSASTQYSSAFAVLSQSQDGAPEGDLVGVTIGNDGLVSASFSNGSQKSLAKILLANFSSPVGLRQIGDSSFLASAASGRPILGTPGSAGFGTPNVNPHVGVGYDMTWGSVSYTQTMDWRFVGKEAYTPVFGNAVDYLVNADSFVAYKWNTLAVGADLNQWYTSGSSVAFLGPKAAWQVSNSVSANAGVGFPVWQDAPQYEKNSCVVGLGVSIGF